MKRPHRRFHLIIWMLIAPFTLLAGLYFWTQRPMTPYSQLPASIAPVEQGDR
ncbi:MAG: hypothetical protein AAFW68_04850 [Pseudomonadota bacterium]